ncbi:hypothetical protein RB601_002862 [Gaeumannomyces tritici]
MAPRNECQQPSFPPVRACLFGMDGLLLDTEDKATECRNRILAKYGRPNLPWHIKAQMMGRPGMEAGMIYWAWAELTITPEEHAAELAAHQREIFPSAAPLPGVEKLLGDLSDTHQGGGGGGHRVHLALATSSSRASLPLKTSHLPPTLFAAFEVVVAGDDERVSADRGKPLPNISIYLAALRGLNESLLPLIDDDDGEEHVQGVEAARRAGMRGVWCPHPMLERELGGVGGHAEVLAGLTGAAGADFEANTLGEIGDGWGEYLPSLENFPFAKYGIVLAEKDTSPSEES